MSIQRPLLSIYSQLFINFDCFVAMVLLTVTPAILKALEQLLAHEKASTTEKHALDASASPSEGPQQWQKIEKEDHKDAEVSNKTAQNSSSESPLEGVKIGNPISYLQVLKLSKDLQALDPSASYHLDYLLRGSQTYIPPPPPKPEKTSEYKALMARLRREEEERKYNAMISPPPPSFNPPISKTNLASASNAFTSTAAYSRDPEDEELVFADINRQVTLIFNVLVSIVACSAGLWIVSRWWSTPARLALSFGGSLLVAAAEVAIYFGYIRRVKEAVKEEKKLVERKEVVRSWVVGKDADDSTLKDETPALMVQAVKPNKDAPRRRKK